MVSKCHTAHLTCQPSGLRSAQRAPTGGSHVDPVAQRPREVSPKRLPFLGREICYRREPSHPVPAEHRSGRRGRPERRLRSSREMEAVLMTYPCRATGRARSSPSGPDPTVQTSDAAEPRGRLPRQGESTHAEAGYCSRRWSMFRNADEYAGARDDPGRAVDWHRAGGARWRQPPCLSVAVRRLGPRHV
jgi:hypothetical protein